MSKELLELEALLDLAKQKVAEAKQQELRRGTIHMKKKIETNVKEESSDKTKRALIEYVEKIRLDLWHMIDPIDKQDILCGENIRILFDNYFAEEEKNNWTFQGLPELKEYVTKGLKEIVVHGDDPNDFDTHYTETFIREIVDQIMFEIRERFGNYFEKLIKEIENS